MHYKFQPTPSARRVTAEGLGVGVYTPISTHTLRKEGDELRWVSVLGGNAFQPTPSARRVTLLDYDFRLMMLISTHTLRKEGDGYKEKSGSADGYFNPHPPQGG